MLQKCIIMMWQLFSGSSFAVRHLLFRWTYFIISEEDCDRLCVCAALLMLCTHRNLSHTQSPGVDRNSSDYSSYSHPLPPFSIMSSSSSLSLVRGRVINKAIVAFVLVVGQGLSLLVLTD